MTWKSSLVIALALSAVPKELPATEAARETYELRYRFSDGQELHYRISDERRMEVQVAETRDSPHTTSTTLRRHRVKDVRESGRATLELTLLRVQLTASSGEDFIEFDSATDELPPAVFRGIQGTIGNPLGLITVSPQGAVSDAQLLIPTQNEEDFAAAQRDLLPILPESPVAVGDTWRDPFEVEILVALNQSLKKRIRLERIYSLESVEDGIATIAVRTVVLSPVQDGFQQGQLIQRSTHGTIQFDIDRGLLVDRLVTFDNTVVGFQGPQTSLDVEGSHRDALVPETDLAAELPEPVR